MSTFACLLLTAVLAGETPAADGVTADEPDSPRAYHEISGDLRDVLRAEAVAKTSEERSRAIRKIVALYTELKRDPRLDSSDTLKGYKAKIWSRMRRIQTDLERELARRGDSPGAARSEEDLRQIAEATQRAAEQVAALHYSLGGPALVFHQTAGAMGGGAMNDYSQQLIELIERTIRPDFWDVHGGPGSIIYYRPLMALVVSATSEVHGNVGGVLGALRRAGN